DQHGRHEIFAGNKNVSLRSTDHNLDLRPEHVNFKKQTDLDDLGIAKNAREEKIRARDLKLKVQQEAENAKMAKLYREVVLKEKRPEGFVGIENLMGSATPKKQTAEEEVGAMGD
ncbi:MAG: radical SAM protein, partial [Candidatus Hydrogenedentes bacterium]|nr:radical SAM protein [Candidatus Hydrogenedentota bacterium]